MELNFSTFFTTVSVHIFNSNYLGFILNNGDKSVHFIDADDVDKFLGEVFGKTRIDFVIEFGIFCVELFHFCGQLIDELFGFCVLHWHLNCFQNIFLYFDDT